MLESPLIFHSTKPKSFDYNRQCGECNMCCKWLFYIVNGNIKHPGKPCFYLGDTCTVYDKRPQSCRNYHCAYIQGILPEWMKPSRSNVLVNVESWGPNKEYKMLRVIECGKKLDSEILSWFVQFSRTTNTGIIYMLSGVWNFVGPDEFLKFFEKDILKIDFINPLLNE